MQQKMTQKGKKGKRLITSRNAVTRSRQTSLAAKKEYIHKSQKKIFAIGTVQIICLFEMNSCMLYLDFKNRVRLFLYFFSFRIAVRENLKDPLDFFSCLDMSITYVKCLKNATF